MCAVWYIDVYMCVDCVGMYTYILLYGHCGGSSGYMYVWSQCVYHTIYLCIQQSIYSIRKFAEYTVFSACSNKTSNF